MLSLDSGLPRVIDACHGLLRWLIPVLAVLELQGDVLRQDAGRMQAQDQCQLPERMYNRPMPVVLTELLRRQRGPEVAIPSTDQAQNLLAKCRGASTSGADQA